VAAHRTGAQVKMAVPTRAGPAATRPSAMTKRRTAAAMPATPAAQRPTGSKAGSVGPKTGLPWLTGGLGR